MQSKILYILYCMCSSVLFSLGKTHTEGRAAPPDYVAFQFGEEKLLASARVPSPLLSVSNGLNSIVLPVCSVQYRVLHYNILYNVHYNYSILRSRTFTECTNYQ